jgi:hypothetical protein
MAVRNLTTTDIKKYGTVRKETSLIAWQKKEQFYLIANGSEDATLCLESLSFSTVSTVHCLKTTTTEKNFQNIVFSCRQVKSLICAH